MGEVDESDQTPGISHLSGGPLMGERDIKEVNERLSKLMYSVI